MNLDSIKCFMRTLVIFNAFMLMSSGPARNYEDIKLFQSPIVYNVDSTILLNDVTSGNKEVGFKIKSKLSVDPIWSQTDSHFLLKFEIESPKLHVRSRAAPHEGFIQHASLLDNYKNLPFFAEWKDGIVKNVYISAEEEPSWVNYKKGLLSIFQFQILDQDTRETDISGKCDTSYESLSQTVIRKVKQHCVHPASNPIEPEIFSIVNNAMRMTRYEFTEDLKTLKHVFAEELHEIRLGIKQDAGNKMRVWQELTLTDGNTVSDTLKAKTLGDAVSEAEAVYGFVLKPQDLKLNVVGEGRASKTHNLAQVVEANRENLHNDNLGTEKSVLSFMKVLKSMRGASTEEILKVLKDTKNKDILQQLLDVAGCSQTLSSHKAATTFLGFDNEYDKDYIDRYLWALSIAPHPHEKVILSVLSMCEDSKLSEPVRQALLLSASAMTHKLGANANHTAAQMVSDKVKDHISSSLSKCKETDCIHSYLRALHNLKRADTLPILLDHIRKGHKSTVVMAMKALRALPQEYWSKDVIKQCKKVLYQTDKQYDSSARAIAVDILIEAKPVLYEIEEMLDFLTWGDDFEVKQIVWQRLLMLAEKCQLTKTNLEFLLGHNNYINNYDVMAQKGLSSALSRAAWRGAWGNVTIESVQEISGGVLRTGRVDLMVEDSAASRTLFSLGLFARGLSGMLGGGEGGDSETATAGLELAVGGATARPLVLFSGQAELMAHVWAGSASERTPALQSLMLLQEQAGQTALGVGCLARTLVTAAASVQLAGQIQISLWSRAAHARVDKLAGVVIQGSYEVDLPFVKSEAHFAVSVEPRLDLESDIDFYDGVKLCVQVQQSDALVRHNVTKLEWVPEHRHVMRKLKYTSFRLPGRTHALNRQNNIMCNNIHNKE